MIEISHVQKCFGDKVVFEDLSLTIEDGEFVVFAGNSGCGKTTLLNMIGGLEKTDRGTIIVDGQNIQKGACKKDYYTYKVGFLFQNFALVENATVRKNLEFVQKKARSGMTIEEVLDNVGLLKDINTEVFKLSGGEQQRVAIARLMYKKCDIILADEPTGSLDKANAKMVMELLHELNNKGKTVLLVTHDESIINNEKKVIKL